MDQTFHSSWVQQVQKTDQSERVLEDQVLGWLRARYGEDYLKHTRHTTIAELQEDVRSNRLCWPARYAVMRHCQYESAAARTYWRRLELFDITPLTYDRFLRHARGTMVIRMEPLKFGNHSQRHNEPRTNRPKRQDLRDSRSNQPQSPRSDSD